MSTAPVIGGNDRVTTLGGNDIILAGVSGDTLETATSGDFRDVVDAGDGNNLVLGDSGLLVFAQPLDDAATTAEISLAVDPTKPVDATDPLNGGVPVDTETAVYTYGYTSDSDPSDLDWIESTAWSVGGADLITTGSGVDLILGGAGGDEIAADSGDNLVFGDNGQIVSATSDAARLGDGATFGPATITLGRVMSTAPAIGGNDRVTTLGGNDIILAGVSGDTLETATSGDFRDVVDAGDGNNLVLGDSGLLVFAQPLDNASTTAEISLAVDPTKPVDATDPLNGGVPVDTETAVYTYGYTSDSDPSDLDWIESTAWSVGGADLITTGSGVDLILGGAGGDEIAAGAGDNLVFGDNGQIVSATSDAARLGDGATFGPATITLGRVMSTAPAIGGNDRVTTLGGNDIILAGVSGDTLETATSGDFRDVVDAGDGNNLVLGDSGLLVFAQTLNDAAGAEQTVTVRVDPTQSVNPDIPANSEYSYSYTPDSDPSYHTVGAEDDIDYITTTAPTIGGADMLTTGLGNDIILGGTAGDTIVAGLGNDLVFGDHGELRPVAPSATLANPGIDATLLPLSTYDPQFTFTAIDTEDFDDADHSPVPIRVGGADNILGGTAAGTILPGQSDQDILLGQQGADTIFGGADDDDLIGGHNVATTFFVNGSIDEAAHDEGDFLDGGTGNDVIAGDNARVTRRGDTLSPRMQILLGTTIYGDSNSPNGDGEALVAGGEQLTPDGVYGDGRVSRAIEIYDHRDDFETDVEKLATHGDDYIAGGGDDDEIFGQLGNDVIQGDGTIEGMTLYGLPVGASRNGSLPSPNDDSTVIEVGTLRVRPSFEFSTDGDDYIEGNGGDDVIFGNLGQDDIVGGSSELFIGLAGDESQRPDGSDLIFGGAGTDLARNNTGDSGIDEGHALDADTVAGDNANIYRLVGITTSAGLVVRAPVPGAGMIGGVATFDGFLAFNYDDYSETRKIIPRAVQLVDYTEGGPDFDPASTGNPGAEADNGTADEIHGESGDDTIYAQVGNDVVYGEGQDDDIVGGWGHDWISGGTGRDGILGDDGRIYTSRNVPGNTSELSEPLYGISKVEVDNNADSKEISTPGGVQLSYINVTGELKKTVNLTPFNVDPQGDAQFVPLYADDIIYGGWDNDFLHGGSGDDAISGAEALSEAAAQAVVDGVVTRVVIGYDTPSNPGGVLGYERYAAAEFALYDEFLPRHKIVLGDDGQAIDMPLMPGMDQGVEFLLNFEVNANDLMDGTTPSDGDDVIFGDLGNDWLVGGTGRDHIYGGYGDDLLNADDNLETNNGLNDAPDGTEPSYEDIAYGGAGRDVLMANVDAGHGTNAGGDRLIDWAGEFNSYLVPFSNFGPPTISRAPQQSIYEYLYDLSESDGADPTRFDDTGSGENRNGEPEGELGLVTQRDFDWQDQTGAPDDPQPGNIQGGPRKKLQTANFNQGGLDAFAVDSGVFTINGGRLEVAPEVLGSDAAAVLYVDHILPTYFELQATINGGKPIGGLKSNAHLIFDYQGPLDFKFAGVNISTNKLQMGHRDANGWHVDVQTSSQLKPDEDYNVLLAINGVTATLVVDNDDVLTHAFAPRIDQDGISHGINHGFVGIGSDNSKARIDNVTAQIVPPEITFEDTDDFSDGLADLLSVEQGQWQVTGANRYEAVPAANEDRAISRYNLSVSGTSVLQLEANFRTLSSGGIIFDQNDPEEFKFVAISAESDQVLIGHHTSRHGWSIDAAVDRTISANQDYQLGVSLSGRTVSVDLNGQVLIGHAFNAVVVDGDFGLLSRDGTTSFDRVKVSTDDPAYESSGGGSSLTAAAAPLRPSLLQDELGKDELEAISREAISRWASVTPADSRVATLGSQFEFHITTLPGLQLAELSGDTIYIDRDAAGHGWFVDLTPEDDLEFEQHDTFGNLVARQSSPALNRIDLLTVVMHELGHALGRTHVSDTSLMGATLDSGVRRVPESPAAAAMDLALAAWRAGRGRNERADRLTRLGMESSSDDLFSRVSPSRDAAKFAKGRANGLNEAERRDLLFSKFGLLEDADVDEIDDLESDDSLDSILDLL